MARDGVKRPLAAGMFLVAIQTVAASILVLKIFPLFQNLVLNTGLPLALERQTVINVLIGTTIMQVCYWLRYTRIPLPVPVHSAALGHVVMFAARTSFFFGGALFSAIFFRHIPMLDQLPPASQGAVKTAGVMFVLFALYCYSLEIERIGRAMEEGVRILRRPVTPAQAAGQPRHSGMVARVGPKNCKAPASPHFPAASP